MSSRAFLLKHSWPMSSLGETIEALARAAGMRPGTTNLDAFPSHLTLKETDLLSRKMADAGARMNLEVDPVEVDYSDASQMLGRGHPAILRLQFPPENQAPTLPEDKNEWYANDEQRFLAILGGNKYNLKILGPDLHIYKVSTKEVTTFFCEPLERPHRQAVDQLLDVAEVPPGRRARAFRALLRERLGARRMRGCWLLRLSPGRPFLEQLKHEGVLKQFAGMVIAYFLQYFTLIFGWWLIGKGALSGIHDAGWMLAWALLLFTEIPMRLFSEYMQGMLTCGTGSLLKRRLLYGTLKLNPENIRLQGAGQLLSRVLESETIEATALSGGFQVVLMVVELSIALWVLSKSSAPVVLPLLLLIWVGVALAICVRHFHGRRLWADQRLSMTHELIEKMVGHRTRLAQESRATWHRDEDLSLRDYLRSSITMDDSETWMNAIVVRGWMVVGMLGIGYGFASGDATRTGLAVALGGILLANRGFQSLSNGFNQAMVAFIAWERVAPLFMSARESDETSNMLLPPAPGAERPMVESYNLTFHYKNRRDPILAGCDLSIFPNDRLLLEGSSGAGKSTLGSLLTGIREPNSGLLLFRGLDKESLGTRVWRKHLVTAPQFHENHVFTETFMFNLLMGCNWPASLEDQKKAHQICLDLGLGPLLERMPSGMLQMLGEIGWQLSHGERSRLFIARTLLQDADMVVLDESFAALDPENLVRAMECVHKYAKAVVVIAHP